MPNMLRLFAATMRTSANCEKCIKAWFLQSPKSPKHNRTTDQKMKALSDTVNAVAEQQKITEEKLHALIDTVDRIIRNR